MTNTEPLQSSLGNFLYVISGWLPTMLMFAWVMIGFVCGRAAYLKGYNGWTGFFAGVCFGVFALIYYAALPTQWDEGRSEESVKLLRSINDRLAGLERALKRQRKEEAA